MIMKKIAIYIPAMVFCISLVLLRIIPGAAEEEKSFTVAFVPGDVTIPFCVIMKNGMLEKAKKLGINIEYDGADEWNYIKQIQILEGIIEEGVDLIIVAPIDGEKLIPVLKKAVDKGMPVITVDTNIDDDSFIVAHIGSDNVQGDKIAAETLSEKIGFKGEIVAISVSGFPALENRMRGFLEAIKAYPDIKLAEEPQYCDVDKEKIAVIIQAIVREHEDLKGIFAADNTSAEGVQEGLKNEGLTGKIALITYDAEGPQVAGLRSGSITALLVKKPFEIGRVAVEYAYYYLTGQKDKIEKQKFIPFIIATPENVDNPEIKKWFYAK